MTRIRHRTPVEEYLERQTRFRHLFSPRRDDEVIARIQARADRNIERFGLAPELDADQLALHLEGDS